MSHGYSISVSHTWSDTRDNQVGEGNGFSSAGNLLDNHNLEQEFGTSLQDLKHRLNVNVTIQLPFGEGRRWLDRAGLLNAVLGGWQVRPCETARRRDPPEVDVADRTVRRVEQRVIEQIQHIAAELQRLAAEPLIQLQARLGF